MTKTIKQVIIAVLFVFSFVPFIAAEGNEFYQIQIFNLNGKAQEKRVDQYLQSAYLPALHRAGIKTVGVFKPIPSDTKAKNQIFVWLPLSSLDQLITLQEVLAKDAAYQKAGADVLDAPFDEVAFMRKESILLKAFPYAPTYTIPTFDTKRSERIYELRSYEGPTENLFRKKVKMFNEGGEINIFKDLGFNAVFDAEVISGSTMPNLMYMTTFADRASHDAHWEAFRNSPDWQKLKSHAEYDHTVSKHVIRLLYPTDYSDF